MFFFLIFGHFFSNCTFLVVVTFYQLNFPVAVRIYKIPVFDETFFLFNCQNANDHQTFKDGQKVRCMTPQWSGFVGLRDKQNTYLHLQEADLD